MTSANSENKDEDDWWSMDKVETFYKECCIGREETVNPIVTTALRHAATTSPRALDLSGIQLSLHSAYALADILSIEWGLRKLVLRECDLTHQTIKPILHALLITNTLLFFSIASNRNMKLPAFKLVGAYVSKSTTIQYLDLSQNALEKKAIEFIVSALGTAPPQSPNTTTSPPQTPNSQSEHGQPASLSSSTSSLLSLRLDDCSLKQPSLEALAQTVRTSSLRNISLRHNRINATGAVALALMIKDYPDSFPSAFSSGSSISSSISGTPASTHQHQYNTLPSHTTSQFHSQSQYSTTTTPTSTTTTLNNLPPSSPSSAPIKRRPVNLAPPPRHPTVASSTSSLGAASIPQTTYTPYIPKARRNVAGAGRSTLGLPPGSGSAGSTPTTPTGSAFAGAGAGAGATRLQQVQQQREIDEQQQQHDTPSQAQTQTQTQVPPSPTESAASTLVDHTDPTHAPAQTQTQTQNPTPVPIITSSLSGGITTRHAPPPPLRGLTSSTTTTTTTIAGSVSTPRTLSGSYAYDPLQQPSAALLDKVRALDNLPRLGALRTLDLKGNDIKGGTLYIAQVLKRNRTLKILNLSENKIDAVGLTQIAESLKYNSCLETLDLSKNPCCGPSLEGIQHLRTALTLNTSLKRLFLSNTTLSTSGAIMLAEFLPEAQALLHLDLTLNPALDHAGVLALSVGIKKNYVIRCLDLNIEPGDEEMAKFCRDILSVCVRNTEEAARLSGVGGGGVGGEKGSGDGEKDKEKGVSGGVGSAGSRAKGVWSMIEESELAKSIHSADDAARRSIKSDSGTIVDADTDVVVRAVECKQQLDQVLIRIRGGGSGSNLRIVGLQRQSTTMTTVSTTSAVDDGDDAETENHAILARSKTVLPLLVAIIQSMTADPDLDTRKLEELLILNDDLTVLIRDTEAALGTRPLSRRNSAGSTSSANTLRLENGHQPSADNPAENPIDDDDIPSPTTPKVDKGKGKALPESQESSPVLQKLIMGPSFSITDSDDEDEEERMRRAELEEELRQLREQQGGEAMVVSPTMDRSRYLLEEEGEIFRKGQALLSEAEMESEYAGEELRQGLLEAQLERPPARQLLESDAGFDENHLIVEGGGGENDIKPTAVGASEEPLRSPTSPGPLSPRTYLVRQRSNGSSSDVAR